MASDMNSEKVMPMLDILTYPDERLRGPSAEVKEITPELRELAENMVQTMYEGNGIGLAAPQVGEKIRLITVDVTGPEERTGLMVLLNPRIVSKEGKTESDEGCLSVPNIRTMVSRFEKVLVKAQDFTDYKTGEPKDVEIEADDLLAICLQHEIDHLDGTLIVDHMSRLKRSLYDKKVAKWTKRAAKN